MSVYSVYFGIRIFAEKLQEKKELQQIVFHGFSQSLKQCASFRAPTGPD